MTRFESAMLKPAELYQSPQQVLAEPWSPEDAFRVLRQWKYDIGQLHVATYDSDRWLRRPGAPLGNSYRQGFRPESPGRGG